MDSVLGTNILVKFGEPRPVTEFRPKYWGIYFGAHWAPPSRKFTNDLNLFYDKVNAGASSHEKVLEVVFASMDGSIKAFEENLAKMHWFGLPYEEEARLAALKVKYDISQLPMLVIVTTDGSKVLSKDARQDIVNAGVDD